MTQRMGKTVPGRSNAPGTPMALDPPATRTELLQEWWELYGCPPPPRLSTRLLRLAVAYQQQAAVHGGLKTKTRKRLQAFAASSGGDGEPKMVAKERVYPATGTRLVREWHGKTHVVDVLEHGVSYEGQSYRSLSEVARTITGARWSGPRFFGL